MTESISKGSVTNIYAQKDSYTYELEDNIVIKNSFYDFKNKFNNVDEVKIKYLPNSHLVSALDI